MQFILLSIIYFLCFSDASASNFFIPYYDMDSLIPKRTVKVRSFSDGSKKKKKKNKTKVGMDYKPQKKVRVDLENLSDNYEAQKKAKLNYYEDPEIISDDSELSIDTTYFETLTEEEILKLYPKKIAPIKAKNIIHPKRIESCNFAYDSTDALSGLRKVSLFHRPFFAYTPDEYLKFFKNEQFINCDGYLSRNSKGVYTLTIKLHIGSRSGKSKFGNLRKNAPLMIYSTNNQSFVLMTYEGGEGKIRDNTTSYECVYYINKSDVNKLKKIEIDKIRLSFAKGYQSFEIFRLDFLKNQFNCLN